MRILIFDEEFCLMLGLLCFFIGYILYIKWENIVGKLDKVLSLWLKLIGEIMYFLSMMFWSRIYCFVC